MPALTISPDQRRSLRAQAHHLEPVVFIGSDGLTPGVSQEVDAALRAHELIKVRVFSDVRADREAALTSLTDSLSAAAVQHIGKLLVLWRPAPPKEKTEPVDRKPGPRTVKVVTFSKSGNHRATVKKVKVLGNQRITAAGSVKRKSVRQVSAKKRANP